jgi:maleylacetate reductase
MAAEWAHTGYAQQILFGAGRLARLPQVLQAVGARRVMFVTSLGRSVSTEGQQVMGALDGALATTFDSVSSQVPAPIVQFGVEQARREGIDGIVSFGGGAAMDTGKAIAFYVEQEMGLNYATWADRPAVPHVAIPTTYAGAEVTPYFSVTDPLTKQRSGSGSHTLAPLAVIYDPILTTSVPLLLTAGTGLTSLAHAIEVAYSLTRTPEAEVLALAAIRRVLSSLPLAVNYPNDVNLRGTMSEAGCISARSMHNASLGAQHGLTSILSGLTDVAHGTLNAVLLPHVLRYTAAAVPTEMNRIGQALGSPEAPWQVIEHLVQRLQLPTRLEEAGVRPEIIEQAAQLAVSNWNVRNNPRRFTQDDVKDLLYEAY